MDINSELMESPILPSKGSTKPKRKYVKKAKKGENVNSNPESMKNMSPSSSEIDGSNVNENKKEIKPKRKYVKKPKIGSPDIASPSKMDVISANIDGMDKSELRKFKRSWSYLKKDRIDGEFLKWALKSFVEDKDSNLARIKVHSAYRRICFLNDITVMSHKELSLAVKRVFPSLRFDSLHIKYKCYEFRGLRSLMPGDCDCISNRCLNIVNRNWSTICHDNMPSVTYDPVYFKIQVCANQSINGQDSEDPSAPLKAIRYIGMPRLRITCSESLLRPESHEIMIQLYIRYKVYCKYVLLNIYNPNGNFTKSYLISMICSFWNQLPFSLNVNNPDFSLQVGLLSTIHSRLIRCLIVRIIPHFSFEINEKCYENMETFYEVLKIWHQSLDGRLSLRNIEILRKATENSTELCTIRMKLLRRVYELQESFPTSLNVSKRVDVQSAVYEQTSMIDVDSIMDQVLDGTDEQRDYLDDNTKARMCATFKKTFKMIQEMLAVIASTNSWATVIYDNLIKTLCLENQVDLHKRKDVMINILNKCRKYIIEKIQAKDSVAQEYFDMFFDDVLNYIEFCYLNYKHEFDLANDNMKNFKDSSRSLSVFKVLMNPICVNALSSAIKNNAETSANNNQTSANTTSSNMSSANINQTLSNDTFAERNKTLIDNVQTSAETNQTTAKCDHTIAESNQISAEYNQSSSESYNNSANNISTVSNQISAKNNQISTEYNQTSSEIYQNSANNSSAVSNQISAKNNQSSTEYNQTSSESNQNSANNSSAVSNQISAKNNQSSTEYNQTSSESNQNYANNTSIKNNQLSRKNNLISTEYNQTSSESNQKSANITLTVSNQISAKNNQTSSGSYQNTANNTSTNNNQISANSNHISAEYNRILQESYHNSANNTSAVSNQISAEYNQTSQESYKEQSDICKE